MDKVEISNLRETFEQFAYQQEGVEYWLARELQFLLGYIEWSNFVNAISKAKISCEVTGEVVLDHFVDVNKMIEITQDGNPKITN
jgi:DNA-damage-inducible protein D